MKTLGIVKPGEVDHIVCCAPDRALCGAYVGGQAVRLGDKRHSVRPCRSCYQKDADGALCPVPGCPGPEE